MKAIEFMDDLTFNIKSINNPYNPHMEVYMRFGDCKKIDKIFKNHDIIEVLYLDTVILTNFSIKVDKLTPCECSGHMLRRIYNEEYRELKSYADITISYDSVSEKFWIRIRRNE